MDQLTEVSVWRSNQNPRRVQLLQGPSEEDQLTRVQVCVCVWGSQLIRVPVLGAADSVQVLLLGGHGGGLQRLCVTLQRAQLLPLAVHVVLVPLQVRRLGGGGRGTVNAPHCFPPGSQQPGVRNISMSDIRY